MKRKAQGSKQKAKGRGNGLSVLIDFISFLSILLRALDQLSKHYILAF
jgi:hypothetical protein